MEFRSIAAAVAIAPAAFAPAAIGAMTHRVVDLRGLPGGLYFATLEADGVRESVRIVSMR